MFLKKIKMEEQNIETKIGSAAWNDNLFLKHPTPYKGIAGKIEYQRAKKIFSILKKNNIKNPANILEIGCEQGNLIEFLYNKMPNNNFFGTDISPVALKKAEEKLLTIKL